MNIMTVIDAETLVIEQDNESPIVVTMFDRGRIGYAHISHGDRSWSAWMNLLPHVSTIQLLRHSTAISIASIFKQSPSRHEAAHLLRVINAVQTALKEHQ